MISQRPAWLHDSCPSWCSAEHETQILAADRHHESDYAVLPAITCTPYLDNSGTLRDEVQAEEVTVVASQRVESLDLWIAIATDHQ